MLVCRQMYALVFNIGITYSIILYASSINVESKLPKYVLFSVPPESYGVEVTINSWLIIKLPCVQTVINNSLSLSY